jgi:hypothetical protein
MRYPSRKTRIEAVRYCIIAILLTVVLVGILSPAFASDNSQIPACASENALKDLAISSEATVFAAGLLAGFNPCLLAILAFLASSILASTGRGRDILTMVALRKNAVSQAVNKMGKSILLYRGEFSWVECLSLYRSKDVVEGFDVLKNDIDLTPANLRTNSSLRGYLFVAFLALILRMKLMRMMIDAGLNKRYSVEGLFTELEKIKVMILPDGEKATTEISKKQREILDALRMCA